LRPRTRGRIVRADDGRRRSWVVQAAEWSGTRGSKFVARSVHRHWLVGQALSLFDFFLAPSFNPAGGFFSLADDGTPMPGKPGLAGVERQIHDTTRMVHCAAIGHLLGLPGAER